MDELTDIDGQPQEIELPCPIVLRYSHDRRKLEQAIIAWASIDIRG